MCDKCGKYEPVKNPAEVYVVNPPKGLIRLVREHAIKDLGGKLYRPDIPKENSG